MGRSQVKQMIGDAGEQQNLGQEIDHFPVHHQLFNRWLLVILGIILIIDGSLCALINIFNLWNAIRSHGRAVLLARITEPMIALLIILPLGILLIILAAVNWQNGLTIFEDGLVIRKRNQKKVWRWDAIERFDNQITLVKFSGTTLTSKRKIILEDEQQNALHLKNNYERMSDLVTQLRNEILPSLFDKKRHHLHHGGKIQFHPDISAFQEGLQIKGILFPWQDLQLSVDKKGDLKILDLREQQEILRIKSNKIHNLDVLVHLIENPPIPGF